LTPESVSTAPGPGAGAANRTEAVGQVRGVQVDEALPGEVAIAVPGDLPQEEVAEGVGPEGWREAIDKILNEALP